MMDFDFEGTLQNILSVLEELSSFDRMYESLNANYQKEIDNLTCAIIKKLRELKPFTLPVKMGRPGIELHHSKNIYVVYSWGTLSLNDDPEENNRGAMHNFRATLPEFIEKYCTRYVPGDNELREKINALKQISEILDHVT